MELSTLQHLALWASIAIAVATVISLIFAAWTYRRNAEAQVQLLALGTLQHYLDRAVEYAEVASRKNDDPMDARYAWFAAHALFTAQTLRTLVGSHAEWQRAINAIVRQHLPYLRSGAFVCEDFAPDFVSYLRERFPDLKCANVTHRA